MSQIKYVGITIGPIYDTISETSSPAMLWLASSIFSDITKRLCKRISEYFEQVQIYTPYYDADIVADDGIGKFHDRIVFSTSDFSVKELNDIIRIVKDDTAGRLHNKFSTDNNKIDFLNNYLQINYVALDEDQIGNKSAILCLSPYLDSLELMKTFPKTNVDNPFTEMFVGDKNSKNSFIKMSTMYNEISPSKNQLKENNSNNIKDIQTIAAGNYNSSEPNLKHKKYFAIVQADGDRMGKFLEGTSNISVTRFSKACLRYAEKAGSIIKSYGGVTVYAGGDDLLFIAPVKSDNMNNGCNDIFTLCNEINKLFTDVVKQEGFNDNIPTISFGISIQYYKFPLYEALANARRLLFEVAKGQKKKNCMAIDIIKHSGQSLSVIVDNNAIDIFKRIILSPYDKNESSNSTIYTMSTFVGLLDIAIKEAANGKMKKEQFISAFNNLFDNVEQSYSKAYRENLADIVYEHFLNEYLEIRLPESFSSVDYKNVTQIIVSCLRIKKFLEEKDGE